MIDDPLEEIFTAIKSNWSDPKAVEKELARLGVREQRTGMWHNFSDGRCDIIYRHENGAEFRLEGNYYNKDCFEPVLNWARTLVKE